MTRPVSKNRQHIFLNEQLTSNANALNIVRHIDIMQFSVLFQQPSLRLFRFDMPHVCYYLRSGLCRAHQWLVILVQKTCCPFLNAEHSSSSLSSWVLFHFSKDFCFHFSKFHEKKKHSILNNYSQYYHLFCVVDRLFAVYYRYKTWRHKILCKYA